METQQDKNECPPEISKSETQTVGANAVDLVRRSLGERALDVDRFLRRQVGAATERDEFAFRRALGGAFFAAWRSRVGRIFDGKCERLFALRVVARDFVSIVRQKRRPPLP